MKKNNKQLTAKLLCVTMLMQLGTFPAGAVEDSKFGANGTIYADGYEYYIMNEDPSEEEMEEGALASGSNAAYDTASDSNAEQLVATSSNMMRLVSEGMVYRELEEDKGNFSLGTVSRISEDGLGGNVLRITSGWDQSRLNGVAQFKNAAELFKREQFTLQAYVYQNGNDPKAAAFTIGESKNFFSVNLTPAALKYVTDGTEKTKNGDEDIPNGWISLDISYIESDEGGQVAVYVNGDELIAATGIGFKLSELDNIKAYVGGTFADTSFMAAGKYDHITVYDWADAVEEGLATASDVANMVEEKAGEYDFSANLEKISSQEEAETAVEAWVLEKFKDILDTGVVIRPNVTEYEAPGEPYREAFNGKPGRMTFSFTVFCGSSMAETTEISAELTPVGGDEIPVYDSFSGVAKGSGNKEYSMWLDTEGKHIQAHGGQVQSLNESKVGYDLDENGEIEDKNVWLWYGENKTRDGKPIDGVKCYVSTDLYNWTDKGTVLQTHDLLPAKIGGGEFEEAGVSLDETAFTKIKAWAEMDAPTEEVSQKDIDMAKSFVEAYVDESSVTGYDEENLKLAFWNLYTGYCIAERPKMLYNEETGQYVVIYHQDAPGGNAIKTYVEEVNKNGSSTNTGSRYARASMGFAVSDSPFGPFKLINVQWMNGYPNEFKAKPGMARDMNVFLDDTDVDQNGVPDAYAIYSSEENKKLYISLLNETYTGPATEGSEDTMQLPDGSEIRTFATRVLQDNDREAPALFKYDGWYYMITSGTSGWNPNKAIYYRAQNIFGPWEKMGDPCEGGSSTTFRSQSTSVIPVDPKNGKYIYMGDRWRVEGKSSALWYSSYVWLPIEFTSDQKLIIKNVSNWDLRALDDMIPIKINTQLPDQYFYGSRTAFPTSLNVTRGGNTFDTPVTWESPSALGRQTIKGTLTELGTTTSATVDVVLNNAVYFVDSGASSTEGRDYFSKIVRLSGDVMKNVETVDQAYSLGSWGYEGENTVARGSGADVYEMLRYVQKNTTNHDISYRFDNLEAGKYKVIVGFYDPWYQYSKGKRKAEITVAIDGEQEGNSVAHTITDAKDMAVIPNVELTAKGSLQVKLRSVNQGNDTDVMVSYLAVCKAGYEPEEPEETIYTVMFDTAGGNAVAEQEVKEGEKAQKPEDPTRAGYTFDGWYKDAGFTEVWDFAADVVTGDTTIYAKWEKDEEPEVPEEKTYTVRFDVAGGNAVEEQEVKEGEKAHKPEDPTRAGYTFEGWYKDAGFTVPWNFAVDVVTEDMTVYAKWEKEEEPEIPEEKTYTVRFDVAGGNAVEEQEVKEGEKAQKPQDPTRAGYLFDGWYKDAGFTETWDFAADIVTEDTTIYAKWEKKHTSSDNDKDYGSGTSDEGSANTSPVTPVLTVTAPAGEISGTWSQSVSGKWQLVKENGAKARNEWGMVSGSWYLFDQNADMVSGWAMVNHAWYFLDPSTGAMKTGWQNVNGKWYYMDPATGMMKTGTVIIDGIAYSLAADGSWTGQ